MDQTQVTREWNGVAGDWDDLAASHVRRVFRHVLMRHLPPSPPPVSQNESETMRIVDFGCGTGLIIPHLLQHYNKPPPDQLTKQVDSSAVGSCQTLALDASPHMIDMVHDKILSCDWNHNIVQAHCVVLAQNTHGDLDWWKDWTTIGQQAHVVIANHVFQYLPSADLSSTMEQLGYLLRSGGLLLHVDFMKTDERPNGVTLEHIQNWHQQFHNNVWKSISIEPVSVPSSSSLPPTTVLVGIVQRI